jgi:hypothetical protein
LNPDFRDMLSASNDAGVEFLIVGAYALAARALPQATGDIDIWVRPSPENAPRVREALRIFGAPTRRVQAGDFATPDVVFQIGVAPRRVDILTSISGVQFDEAWGERETVVVEGLTLCVLSRRHLITNKRAAGRPKDLTDVIWLEDEGQ